MDLLDRIDELIAYVEGARAMPMSASCILNREELLGMLDELRAEVPAEVRRARSVLDDRDEVLSAAQEEAARIVEAARGEADQIVADAERAAQRVVESAEHEHLRLVSESAVIRRAEAEATRVIDEATDEAAQVRQETDDYVDERLAAFEDALHRTLRVVERGRDNLRIRTDADADAHAG